jgi:hypothetical protein
MIEASRSFRGCRTGETERRSDQSSVRAASAEALNFGVIMALNLKYLFEK